MPTKRKFRLRKRQLGGVKLTPAVRTILSTGIDFFGDLDDLMPFDRWGLHKSRELHESPAAMKFLREQWRLHKFAVLEWHIAREPGTRPWAFFEFGDAPAPRPFVRPSSGTCEDSVRYHNERKIADIKFLIEHGLLSKAEEKAIVAEARDEATLRCGAPPREVI
jgi:hypothetical protein